MKTGDTIRDASGVTYTMGRVLGRGLWGKTFIAQSANKTQCIFKVPFAPNDLPYGSEKLAQISRSILLEQGELLSQSPDSVFVRPADRFTTQSGLPCLRFEVLPSMAYQIRKGIRLEHTLSTVLQIANRLQSSPERDYIHGNLHLTNVFYHPEHGVLLSDPMSPTLRKHLSEFLELAPHKVAYFAPEIRDSNESKINVASDMYALAMIIYRCTMHHKDSAPNLPLGGLNRALKTDFQEIAQKHLAEEGSNPRFRTRLSISLGRFIGRALSQPVEPSPPYRFHRLDETAQRLNELSTMFAPYIERVGKIIWNLPISKDQFFYGEAVEFSCSVDTNPQLDNFEDIACGLAVIDDNTGEPIKEHSGSFTVDTHAGGRLRFSIQIPNLPPSQYTIRAAFRIAESMEEPEVTEASISVVPPPGFVPSEKPLPESTALRFPESSAIANDDISEVLDSVESTISPIPQATPKPNVVIPLVKPEEEKVEEEKIEPVIDFKYELNELFSEDESQSAVVLIPHTIDPEIAPPLTSKLAFGNREIKEDDNFSIDDSEEDSFGVWDANALKRPNVTHVPITVEEHPPPITELISQKFSDLLNDPIKTLIVIILIAIILIMIIANSI